MMEHDNAQTPSGGVFEAQILPLIREMQNIISHTSMRTSSSVIVGTKRFTSPLSPLEGLGKVHKTAGSLCFP